MLTEVLEQYALALKDEKRLLDAANVEARVEMLREQTRKSASDNEKKCHYCAEAIKVEAIICKHCKSNLQKPFALGSGSGSMERVETATSRTAISSQELRQKRAKHTVRLALGLAVCVLVIALVFGVPAIVNEINNAKIEPPGPTLSTSEQTEVNQAFFEKSTSTISLDEMANRGQALVDGRKLVKKATSRAGTFYVEEADFKGYSPTMQEQICVWLAALTYRQWSYKVLPRIQILSIATDEVIKSWVPVEETPSNAERAVPKQDNNKLPPGWIFYRDKQDNDYLLVNTNLGYRGESVELGHQGVGTNTPGDIQSLAWTNAIASNYLKENCEEIAPSQVPIAWREALAAKAGITPISLQKESSTESSESKTAPTVSSKNIGSNPKSQSHTYSIWGPEVFENSDLFNTMGWSSLYQSSEGRVYVDGKRKRLLFIECLPSTHAVVCAKCVPLDSEIVGDTVAYSLESLYRHFIWQANDPMLASRYSNFRGTRNQDRYGGFEIGGCESDFIWASSIPSWLTVQTAEGLKTVALIPMLAGEQQSNSKRNVNRTLPIPAGTKMGNIAPYRKEMLARIAEHWQPPVADSDIVIMVEIGKQGEVMTCQIIEGSGDNEVDQRAIATIHETKYAPLPAWYKGESIPFKIQLSKANNQATK